KESVLQNSRSRCYPAYRSGQTLTEQSMGREQPHNPFATQESTDLLLQASAASPHTLFNFGHRIKIIAVRTFRNLIQRQQRPQSWKSSWAGPLGVALLVKPNTRRPVFVCHCTRR